LLKKTKEKNALMKKIERISSEERPLTSSRKLPNQQLELNNTIGWLTRTTRNLKKNNGRIPSKEHTTKPSES